MSSVAEPANPPLGKRVVSPRLVGIQSWVLIVMGGLLAIGMALLLVNLWPTLTHPGVEVGGSTFGGTAEQAGRIIVLLAWVLLLGVIFAAIGVRQLLIRRMSKLAFLALVLVPVTIGLAWSTSTAFG